MRRTSSGILANPVLVGAVTVLVTMVAVFLAYNANNGLPFVPTTALKVQLPNGANLVRGNEVRSGGYRVGVIEDMKPVPLPDGKTGAEVLLKLDKGLGDIPRDSTAVVRPRSALGLKYLDLREGSSREAFNDGDTIAVGQTSVPVDLDEVLNTFDKPTRDAAERNLQGFGDSFAGRGRSVGRTVEELPRLFGGLESVMSNLADPDTELRNFFKELGDTARVVAPVSDINARTFTTMADTFEAIGRDEAKLKEFISKSPPTEDVAIDSFRAQRPFLTDFADFSEDFQGATRALRGALPTVNAAIRRGIGVQNRIVPTNRALGQSFGALRELTAAAPTGNAVRGLTATVTTLNPQMRFYGPFVTVCNFPNYFFTFLAEHFSEPDTTGSVQRALVNTTGRQDDSFGSIGANAPANGEGVQEGNPQFMHGADLTAAVDSQGRADCENGQRGYLHRQAKYYDKKFLIHRDPRNPGLQGNLFVGGRASVPPGQTFSALPETSAYPNFPESESGDK